jgi:hypothetical protein
MEEINAGIRIGGRRIQQKGETREERRKETR